MNTIKKWFDFKKQTKTEKEDLFEGVDGKLYESKNEDGIDFALVDEINAKLDEMGFGENNKKDEPMKTETNIKSETEAKEFLNIDKKK